MTETLNESYLDSPEERLKHKILLVAHTLLSAVHVGIVYVLFLQWTKTNNPQQNLYQIICLFIIGICLAALVITFFLACRKNMKNGAKARKLFRIWPLLHISMATVYQLGTQIIISHLGAYQITSLYTAYATTFSVLAHVFLHSVELFAYT